MLIEDAVHVWSEPDGEWHVQWRSREPGTQVTVEPLNVAADTHTEYHPEGDRARCRGLSPHRQHFFRLRDQHGTEVVAAQRRLGMHGAPNFRDFGGYASADGRQVKWGYLFRSGQLSSLSDQDVALLASLELDLVCDFRRIEEQQNDPSRLPGERPPRIASLPIVPGSNARFFEEGESQDWGRDAMFDFMLEVNRDFAAEQAPAYARMFQEILAHEDARFLVHCAAGKDRTGFAAAVVLLALGVSRETVMHDYLLTQRYFHPQREIDRLRDKYQMEHVAMDGILPMLEVHEQYLAKALAVIDGEYPSIEAYLADALGVGEPELAELRARYLV
ncbi:MAG: tyrosine-protein phosphatase [Pseudomonadota bacterium]